MSKSPKYLTCKVLDRTSSQRLSAGYTIVVQFQLATFGFLGCHVEFYFFLFRAELVLCVCVSECVCVCICIFFVCCRF